ncbi:MAG: hypothetical protein MPL62_18245 [Alphaproteobacteria bacterium]|nr:hypothetical protein [Alphaproteobacteria bacterium]
MYNEVCEKASQKPKIMPTRKMKMKPVNGSGYMKQEKASMGMGKAMPKGMNAKGNKAYCPKIPKL